MSFETFFAQYLDTALWSTNDESTPEGGEPLDRNYDSEDFAPETLATMRAECKAFFEANKHHWSDDSLAGHDFWLTRNRHGAGFWDGDYPEDVGDILTKESHAAGARDLYIGDDGKVWQA